MRKVPVKYYNNDTASLRTAINPTESDPDSRGRWTHVHVEGGKTVRHARARDHKVEACADIP